MQPRASVSSEFISGQDKEEMLSYAYSVLDGYFNRPSDNNSEIPKFIDYDHLFITFLNNNSVRCSMGAGVQPMSPARLKNNIEHATTRCIKDDRFGGVTKEEEIDDTVIVFSFLVNKTPISGGLSALTREIELGVHGVEIVNGGRNAFFKESVAISKNYDHTKMFERLCRKAELGEDCINDPQTIVYRYDTYTFMGDRAGKITDLYRYNTQIAAEDINQEYLNDRIKLSVGWFKNNVNPQTGLLEYMYYPSDDRYSTDNNHVRQIATAWSVAKLRNYFSDRSLDGIVNSSLDHYLQFLKCEREGKRTSYCFAEIDGSAKLAYNAFLIFLLLESPDYPNSQMLLAQIARGIVSQQQEDGSYNTYFNSTQNSGQDYYPGEAVFALMKLYQKTENKNYLESVQKAFPYYRNYWRENKNTAFIPWHSQAYRILYEETKDPEVADFIFEMNDWIVQNHQTLQSPYGDLIGGMPRGQERNSTSSYMEGLTSAHVVAQLAGDKNRVRKYGDAIKRGIRFILLTQYTPENSFYVPNQDRAVGGFRSSLANNSQRIDFVQHAVFALLDALETGVFSN
ncbi:AMMECR1 domain-containing protein [Patescibacteria group bacterium]|nr:AMMECR1 domain-containing protein [Patescibacteria group bacterium]MBU1123195.1 AMMECR1 domain-containing protein [Patescibacteria group bacterium]MBU1911298.1 AMMECR1 domain-containing protein [Patescibacteria group bacterium]